MFLPKGRDHMTDSEKLDLLLEKVSSMDLRLKAVESSNTDIKLYLENTIDNNIQLLAENHLTLIDKLNASINVSDKSKMYELKVNYLLEQVKKLQQEVDNLKRKIA